MSIITKQEGLEGFHKVVASVKQNMALEDYIAKISKDLIATAKGLEVFQEAWVSGEAYDGGVRLSWDNRNFWVSLRTGLCSVFYEISSFVGQDLARLDAHQFARLDEGILDEATLNKLDRAYKNLDLDAAQVLNLAFLTYKDFSGNLYYPIAPPKDGEYSECAAEFFVENECFDLDSDSGIRRLELLKHLIETLTFWGENLVVKNP